MNQKFMIGIIGMVFGAFYFIFAFRIPNASMGDPLGPKYFPIGLGSASFLLGIIMILVELKKKGKVGDVDPPEEQKKVSEGEKPKDIHHIKLIMITIVLGIVYASIFNTVGYIVSTLFFLGGLLFLVNGFKSWKMNLVITVIFTFGINYIFENIFLITLP